MVPRAKQSHGYFSSLQIIQLLMDTGYRQRVVVEFSNQYDRKSFPGGPSCKLPTCQCRRWQTHGLDSWVRKVTWRRAWQARQYPCLENPMDRGASDQIRSDQSLSRVRLFVIT